MRAIEAAAIESGAASGLALMERAGTGVVAAILAAWPDLGDGPARALILCGPGNNGGDGYVIARLLAGRGWEVRVLALGDPARLPPDARVNAGRWRVLGPIHTDPTRQDPTEIVDDLTGDGAAPLDRAPCVVIDAVFGIGLTGDISDDARILLQAIGDMRTNGDAFGFPVHVVAVDVPSGLCADTGVVRGTCVRADLTVTFHRAKPGHRLRPDLCGRVEVVDIGLPA